MTTDQVLPGEDPQAHRRAGPDARKPADQRQRAGDVAGRTLLTTVLNAAPPARQPPITRRLHRAEQLGAGNFPLIWHDTTSTARRPSPAADQPSPAS